MSAIDTSRYTAIAAKVRYATIAGNIAAITAEKNAAYGDSFNRSGGVIKTLYPDGISHDQMDDALTVVRIVDKLFRVAARRDAFGESPYRDIMGYALLGEDRVQRTMDEQGTTDEHGADSKEVPS